MEEVELIVGADLESELLDVQIDPRSHELAHGGASWSIELYRAEGSRSQCGSKLGGAGRGSNRRWPSKSCAACAEGNASASVRGYQFQ